MLRLADGELVLAATDLTNYLACEHLTQQRLAIARGERGRPRPADDPHAELIRSRGETHEREQLARLTVECGAVVDLSEERTEAATAAAMRAGAPLIYQATLFEGRWQGRSDFLRRIEEPSALGSYSYEVLDTKLARAVKPEVVHQLSLYSRLVGEIQGIPPELAHVILGDGTTVPIELRRYAALHRHVVRDLERIAAAPGRATYPEPVAHCAICALEPECRARWVADDHLSLVAGARRDKRERLVALGLPTVAALAATEDPPPDFALLHHQAALQVRSRETGAPTHRHLAPARATGYAMLPDPSPGDVFFDLEGDPYVGDGGIEYLWGWWTADAGYECQWAHDVAAEKAALEQFVDRVFELRARHPGLHVYHYAPHERSKLRSLAMLHATREDEVDDLLRGEALVDLYAVVRHAMQVGEESYSLKALERHHGFQRLERRVREGGGSIVAYETWLETADGELLDAIRAYNDEDCRSTASLRDWILESMQPEAEAELRVRFADLREPEPEVAREPPAWMPAVHELADRLTAAGDELLAHLLLYHHREGKPAWWRYFDLRGKSVTELMDERDALAGLVLDETEPPVPYKRSLDRRYTFPPQEFKLDKGQAEDPTTGEGHNVVHVADDHVVLRREASKPAPRPAALVGGSPIGVAVLREALVDLAQNDGRYEAVRALLRRDPPRLRSGRLGEDVDALTSAALGLDRSILPIQGPPGTGKTYRAARMIVGALSAGRRVGVTAFSHAAIQNLLREIENVAAARGVAFPGVYKGAGYESRHGLVEAVDDNDAVTHEHRLVAGTAWLFARPEHRAAFDLLFVDEAGQFPLANAAAVGVAAASLVLLGDPQQLPQVTQADHPGDSGASVLEHLLAGARTIAPDRGVLLTESWRMHPDVCAFVSERSYDGRLHSREACALRRVDAAGPIAGAGLRALPIAHDGRSQASPEEAAAIAAACQELLAGATVTDDEGRTRPLVPADILVVAPYNMAVRTIRLQVPDGVRVGTVDRFQGQQGAIVFYAMTCSSGEDVPRGLEFLFDAHRLNVAVSRAQCLAVLVHSPRLLDADCRTLETMELVDAVCRFVELAARLPA
jgi:uncharacterized protein